MGKHINKREGKAIKLVDGIGYVDEVRYMSMERLLKEVYGVEPTDENFMTYYNREYQRLKANTELVSLITYPCIVEDRPVRYRLLIKASDVETYYDKFMNVRPLNEVLEDADVEIKRFDGARAVSVPDAVKLADLMGIPTRKPTFYYFRFNEIIASREVDGSVYIELEDTDHTPGLTSLAKFYRPHLRKVVDDATR